MKVVIILIPLFLSLEIKTPFQKKDDKNEKDSIFISSIFFFSANTTNTVLLKVEKSVACSYPVHTLSLSV